MRPRLHNTLSYSFALAVFLATMLLRVNALGGLPATGGSVALCAAAMWCVHFARRTAESLFVHRYSKSAVPVGDWLTEYLYYWGFAAWNAYSLFSPTYAEPFDVVASYGLALFFVAELGNAKTHRILRALRAPGSNARVIPRGFLFEWVSCPHYLFEILSWVGFAMLTRTWAALAFSLLGAGILVGWARSRHHAYAKDFDGVAGRELYPCERKALIPFVL